MAKVEVGSRWGLLTALCVVGRRGHAVWLFRCDCGRECERTTNNVHTNVRHSCGCSPAAPGLTHGGSSSTEYRQWSGAKARCYNSRNKDFARYGARGIVMCDRWRASFAAFRYDMGPRPAGMSLDRIDTNGNYEPRNCQWATASEQQRNKTNGARIAINGEHFDSITSAARHFGVSLTTINRWCEGSRDDRRGTFTPPRLGAIKTRAYQ